MPVRIKLKEEDLNKKYGIHIGRLVTFLTKRYLQRISGFMLEFIKKRIIFMLRIWALAMVFMLIIILESY